MRSSILLSLVAGLAVTAPALAQTPPDAPRRAARAPGAERPERPMPRPDGAMLGAMVYAPRHLVDRREALNLTADQVAKLEALAQEGEALRVRADSEVRGHEEALRAAWDAGEPDVRAIETHTRAVLAARQAAQIAAVTTAARAKAVLTPEQRGQVKGWMQGAAQGMRGRMMPRGGRGPRPRGPASARRDRR